MRAYYNEIDPAAAQWLRNLIEAGHIAPGDVDERSIEDVTPGDLAGYTQCHFFAGIGVWSYALRRAGWPDGRPVWTGSCPCQPFSSAGAQAGFDDERHLWPHFHWLIEQCRPAVVFGEQVASKAVEPWVDLVHADLEALDYAFGCVPFPSAGVGAPHIRDRLFWVADANGGKQQGQPVIRGAERYRQDSRRQEGVGEPEPYSDICVLADPDGEQRHGSRVIRPGGRAESTDGSSAGGLADPASAGFPYRGAREAQPIIAEIGGSRSASRAGPTNGFWRAADWLLCRDGKWRPVEPGTFPLVDGAPARVVRLRAYGNAINAEAAREFIGSVMECIG